MDRDVALAPWSATIRRIRPGRDTALFACNDAGLFRLGAARSGMLRIDGKRIAPPEGHLDHLVEALPVVGGPSDDLSG